MDLHGVGPVVAARTLADGGDIARFADATGSHPGPAPHPKRCAASSAGSPTPSTANCSPTPNKRNSSARLSQLTQAREGAAGRLKNPARSTYPRTSTLRISHFPDRPVKIPAEARHTRTQRPTVEDRKGPLVSVGPNRLVTPLLSSAMVLASTAITYPHPRHARRSASQRVRPARWQGPQLPRAFPTNLDAARPGLGVCAGHRPAAPGPDDRQNKVVFDTPTRYTRRASDHVSAGQRPSHARGGR
jgi:hypothetical protein